MGGMGTSSLVEMRRVRTNRLLGLLFASTCDEGDGINYNKARPN